MGDQGACMCHAGKFICDTAVAMPAAGHLEPGFLSLISNKKYFHLFIQNIFEKSKSKSET
jgi:hypothetical protein